MGDQPNWHVCTMNPVWLKGQVLTPSKEINKGQVCVCVCVCVCMHFITLTEISWHSCSRRVSVSCCWGTKKERKKRLSYLCGVVAFRTCGHMQQMTCTSRPWRSCFRQMQQSSCWAILTTAVRGRSVLSCLLVCLFVCFCLSFLFVFCWLDSWLLRERKRVRERKRESAVFLLGNPHYRGREG